MKSIVPVLVFGVIVIIIFIEGFMIVDQEIRIGRLKKHVADVTGTTEALLERAELILNRLEQTATSTDQIATSTEGLLD